MDVLINKLKRVIKSAIEKIGVYIQINIKATCILDGPRELFKISNKADIFEYVIIRASTNSITIEENSQIGPFTVILVGSGIIIKKNVLIGPHCVLAAGNHDYIQTKLPMRFAGDLSKGPIIIDEDVWIGANCTITDGVTIGKGSIIGANSVVTKNVKPYTIVAGVPAKIISRRKI